MTNGEAGSKLVSVSYGNISATLNAGYKMDAGLPNGESGSKLVSLSLALISQIRLLRLSKGRLTLGFLLFATTT
jgi:hypothetical protein